MKTSSAAQTDDTGYRASVVAALLAAHARETGAPSVAPSTTDSVRAAWLSRLRRTRWAMPAAKLGGLLLALLVLAGVGLWADPQPHSAPAASASVALQLGAPPEAIASASATAPADAPPAPPSEPPPQTGVLPDGRIVLNLATEDELTKLPHVGVKRAKDIVALRQRLGRFRALTDLLRVRGLGRKTLAKIAPKIVLDPPRDVPPAPA